ncbi:hypothetical protein tb265_02120 [Gemmatimonadetes bacterium T265]|nr:hypothetical protein tb265_02120 [Gemmatimonadetes bacterium T265]
MRTRAERGTRGRPPLTARRCGRGVRRALVRLGALDPRRLRVLEYRVFAGFTAEETAEVLGVSIPTVERE